MLQQRDARRVSRDLVDVPIAIELNQRAADRLPDLVHQAQFEERVAGLGRLGAPHVPGRPGAALVTSLRKGRHRKVPQAG